ncbi:hypothetical protein HJC23_007816 [Cyclotella cryptica]|uniref:Uncharacterized protein n=1 Tax=Cyclotella cryptica TaxID=29204 RepID=A0ABD3QZS1_9STRA
MRKYVGAGHVNDAPLITLPTIPFATSSYTCLVVLPSPNVLSYVKKLRPLIRSGSGFPSGVHCVTELYFCSTRQTRCDLESAVLLADSRELSGRIRMATERAGKETMEGQRSNIRFLT